jgi:hypothetical protein
LDVSGWRISLFSAMVKVERAYQLGKWTLVFSSFGLDADALQENVEELVSRDQSPSISQPIGKNV